jgi:hypothetical protein
MNNDTLYLLKPNFQDKGKLYFCPGCAEVVGFLEFYPAVKQSLSVRYLDFSRPRPDLVSLLGEENQSCPVLVLGAPPANFAHGLNVHTANGHAYVEGGREITAYLAYVHGTGIPH